MLLRLAYLAATSVLSILRLLTMSEHEKDAEILALRHQLLEAARRNQTASARYSISLSTVVVPG
ncbi:hypothetical protein [Peterkaempfera sp. SMS 1(5)a]|uniref:hypothetical protein n=1 Tax=Peterkaempfera podocarpi TaxID=3232308 RepID=UPI00366EC444